MSCLMGKASKPSRPEEDLITFPPSAPYGEAILLYINPVLPSHCIKLVIRKPMCHGLPFARNSLHLKFNEGRHRTRKIKQGHYLSLCGTEPQTTPTSALCNTMDLPGCFALISAIISLATDQRGGFQPETGDHRNVLETAITFS